MSRLLCVGDLHLGAGVERYGPSRLADQAEVWSRVADVALEESCDLVAFAGDGFERRRYPSQAELVAFDQPLRRLAAAGVPVVAVSGNHDVLAPDAPTSLDVFSDVMTVATAPQVVKAAGVSVGCLPWTPISRLVASRNGGDRDALYEEAAALLHAALRGLRDEIKDGPAVLLAHWSVSGAVTPTGRDVGLDFGVVLDAAELEAMGWDAVVVGHVHKAQLLNSEHDGLRDVGPMFFTGSPLPLNHGEASCDHGVWILDVAEATTARFVPLPSRLFVTVDLDVTHESDVVQFAAVHPPIFGGEIVRVRYEATEEQARRISPAEIKRALLESGASHVTIEPEIVREDRARVHIDTDNLTELDALQLWLDSQGVNGDRGSAMVERTQHYLAARS